MPSSREVDTTPEGVPEATQPGDVLSAEVSSKMPEVPGTADWTLSPGHEVLFFFFSFVFSDALATEHNSSPLC